MRFARAALIAFGLLFVSTATAVAQVPVGVYHYRVVVTDAAAGLPLTVGVDDGTGFSFATLTDHNGDGEIELPRVPVPGRLALGVTPTADHIPGCDIWDFSSNGVSRASVPLLINALANESVGIDFGELMPPPREFTPGERFTVAGGVLPEWPGIRLVDESSVPDLETFLREVDTLPGFNGEVVVSNTTVHFTLVPEPSGIALVTSGLIAVGYLRHRWNRCGRIGTAGESLCSAASW